MTKAEYDQLVSALRMQLFIADLTEQAGGEGGKIYADAVRTTVKCLRKDLDEIYRGGGEADA